MRKEKVSSNKTWKLAGEPIYSTLLTSAEREEIEEEFWVYKRLRGRETGGMPAATLAEARTHESAVQTVAGVLCQHYAGRFQRTTVIKVTAATAAVPANLPKRTADRLDFLMGRHCGCWTIWRTPAMTRTSTWTCCPRSQRKNWNTICPVPRT